MGKKTSVLDARAVFPLSAQQVDGAGNYLVGGIVRAAKNGRTMQEQSRTLRLAVAQSERNGGHSPDTAGGLVTATPPVSLGCWISETKMFFG
jgi:hypothetical protein